MLVELFLGHAVRATKIAPIHHGNAQVMQGAPQPVERVVRTTDVLNKAAHGLTNDTRWPRSLWRRCWARAAVPRSRPYPRGSKNRLSRSAAGELPTGAPNHRAQWSPARNTR